MRPKNEIGHYITKEDYGKAIIIKENIFFIEWIDSQYNFYIIYIGNDSYRPILLVYDQYGNNINWQFSKEEQEEFKATL